MAMDGDGSSFHGQAAKPANIKQRPAKFTTLDLVVWGV